MRGYLSRTGVAIVAGLALVLGLAALGGAGRAAQHSLAVAGYGAGQQTLGPFQVRVERFELVSRPGGRQTAVVQIHLWRPGGAVPLRERIGVDGGAVLQGGWVLQDKVWLIRNELMQRPAGRTYPHPLLGTVPATHHAGEARGIFEFDWLCPVVRPAQPFDFTLRLADGRQCTFQVVRGKRS